MSKKNQDNLDAVEFAAVELILQVKRLGAYELEMPVIDKSNIWLVTIKRMNTKIED
jgi:hypothetical protein